MDFSIKRVKYKVILIKRNWKENKEKIYENLLWYNKYNW